MKQILLVDDDFLALNAFYSLTDWAQLGLRIAHEAHSGSEALSYLRSCPQLPDVAFIDVCMPDTDGIALLSTLRTQYPSIICFMLSSHSDYPYVRETLKLGAADYLLKHEISASSIIDALSQHGLVQQNADAVDTPDQQLARVLAGDTSCHLQGHLLCAAHTDTRPLLDAQRASIVQTCRHILNNRPGAAVCTPDENTLAILLPPDDTLDAARQHTLAGQSATLLQKTLLKYYNVHYSFSTPQLCPDSAQLLSTYHLFARTYESKIVPRIVLSAREHAVLTLAIANGSKPLLTQTLHTLFDAESDAVAELSGALLSFLAQVRQDMGLPAASLPPVPRDRAQAQDFFFNQLAILCDHASTLANARFSPAIRDALDYINHHYAEDIQLSDVARHCHLSYTHLSYLFKKETGDNMIRHLTRVRVYHAAYALLFGGMSVSAACQYAGFKGYNHFVTTFKSITGMTPSEFRKSPDAVNWLLSSKPGSAAKNGAQE